jgi:site-specific DNA-methyltransferase (adenine-specific)
MDTKHKIIIGDARDIKEISDKSVHLVITSPPYWQLKDYGTNQQIGFNDTYQDYINNLNLVWQECYRVLYPGCRLCINIGDQFARSVYYGRYKVVPIRTEIIKFCETVGFDYMGAVIWQKVTTCNTTGGATIMGSFPYPRNGILKIDYEFILIFKKTGTPPKVSKNIKEESRLTDKEWHQYFTGHWNFPGERQNKHLATFPEELPKRLIKMFSFVGETVLDPFLGSGTTTLAAQNLQRNSIGCEINEEYLPIIKEKVGLQQNTIFPNNSFEIIKQEKKKDNGFKEKIKGLPYIFKDPIKFDKKIDPRKMKFGSKIDIPTSKPQETYYTVKKVISPEKILLSNDITIRLLGIKEKPELNGQAVEFLVKQTCGQKVYIKLDKTKHDKENNLLCYLYLSNRTFVNAHLIRSGLVDVDTNINYRYKNRLINQRRQ